jgi:hypothetical protein
MLYSFLLPSSGVVVVVVVVGEGGVVKVMRCFMCTTELSFSLGSCVNECVSCVVLCVCCAWRCARCVRRGEARACGM